MLISQNPMLKRRLHHPQNDVNIILASFAEAATVLLDPLALTVFDGAHRDDEERWFTPGRSSSGRLLEVAHTSQATGPDSASARIISVREAARTERRQYDQNPDR
jgi:uncharacterized DUF497 family protein